TSPAEPERSRFSRGPRSPARQRRKFPVQNPIEQRIAPGSVCPMCLAMAAIKLEPQLGQELLFGLIEIVYLAPNAMQAQFLETVFQKGSPGIRCKRVIDVAIFRSNINREIAGSINPIDIAKTTSAKERLVLQ